MSSDLLQVRHNEMDQRFEAGKEPALAVLTYTPEGDRVIFDHTFVPDELRGSGIGANLVQAALEEAQKRGWKVVPQCWFVAKYIDRHPEFQAVLA